MTPRQRETLIAYLATGSRKEAAARLGVAPQTVKSHLSGAYACLGVENALEAARLLGWLRVPDPADTARRRLDGLPRPQRGLLILRTAHRRRLRILGQHLGRSGSPAAEREVGAFPPAGPTTAARSSRGLRVWVGRRFARGKIDAQELEQRLAVQRKSHGRST